MVYHEAYADPRRINSRSVVERLSIGPIMRKLVQEKIAEVERSIEYLEP